MYELIWNDCLSNLSLDQICELAAERGVSDQTIDGLRQRGLIGACYVPKWERDCVCFPIHNKDGSVFRAHCRSPQRNGDDKWSWAYEPDKDPESRPIPALVFGNPDTANKRLILESQWDGISAIDKLDLFPQIDAGEICLIMTRGAEGTGRLREFNWPSGIEICAFPQNDAPGRKWLANVIDITGGAYVVSTPDAYKDLGQWLKESGAEAEDIHFAMKTAELQRPAGEPGPSGSADDGLGHEVGGGTKNVGREDDATDKRPVVMHPVNDRYISEFAGQLGGILKSCGFYRFNGVAVQVREGMVKAYNGKEYQVKKLVNLSESLFSTLIESYCRPMVKTRNKMTRKSISMEIAKRTLVCLDFINQLPEIKFWTEVQLPVRNGDQITLTQPGYDSESGIYTSPDAPEIDETVTLAEAARTWRELMREFCFPKSGKTEEEEPNERLREPERERCIAVALAAALTPLCLNLLPEKAKRPGFAASANAEGAGKTLLLSFGMVAKLGFIPTGSAPDSEDEMRKVLDSAVHYVVPILFFDNLKGHLSSGELEAFITGSTRR